MEAAPTPGATPHVLVIPFPAQGHALPLLDFVALLAARGLRLTVVTTPANLQLLSPLLAAHPTAVRAATFPFPSHPSLPPGLENTKGCSPGHFPAFVHALAELRRPILAWVKAQPDPVVADFFCGWAQPLAREIPSSRGSCSRRPGIVFSPSGVLGTAVPHSTFRRLVRRPAQCDDDDEFSVSFPASRHSSGVMYRNYMAGALDEQVAASVRQNFLWNLNDSWGFVFNSFRALEGRYLEQPLEDLCFRRAWAVGPVAPEADAAGTRGGQASVGLADLSAWLDAFPEGSVVYVCFGSQAVLSPAVAAALAEALERSAVPFVWAVGGAVVPDGFEARRGGARVGAAGGAAAASGGGVVRDALRLELDAGGGGRGGAHAGVAPGGRPVLRRAAARGRGLGFVPEAGELASVLADATGEKGRDVRARAKALAAEAARAVKPGGSSYADLELLVQEIRRLAS